MTTNATKLNKIKKLQNEINEFNELLSILINFEKNFNLKFPKHSFSATEKTMIQNEISLLQDKITAISITLEKGEVLDSNEVSKVVIEAWGRTKIKTTILDPIKNNDEFECAQNSFTEICGITFEQSEIQIIEYYLDTDNRSDLWLVRAFLAPGFAFASLDTGRVGWGVDVLSNDKFLKELAAQIDS